MYASLDRFYPEIEEFVHETERMLGVEVRVLRCLDQGNLEEGRPRLYSAVASDDPKRLDDDFRWTDAAEACNLGGLDDSQADSIRLECERVSSPAPESPTSCRGSGLEGGGAKRESGFSIT